MSNRNAILLRPQWMVTNQLTMPLVTHDVNGNISIRGLVQVAIPITIFLDTLFDERAGYYNKRSVQDDQLQIFKTIEGALQATGVDGKGCLLRTICEMQKNPIGEFTMIGEIATILLTPKRGVNSFLHEYLDAEYIGQSANMSCAAEFRSCPISLFNLFKSYSTPDDRPISIEDVPLETDEPDSFHQDDRHHHALKEFSLDSEPNHWPLEDHHVVTTN